MMMSARIHFGLIFLSAVAQTWAYNSYMITCPEAIRPGMPFECLIDRLKRFPSLKGYLELTSGEFKVSQYFRILKEEPDKLVSLDIPARLPSKGSYQLSVMATDFGGNLLIKNTTTLTMKDKSMSVFIQTDKAIYKPGQTVQFRCFAVGPDLKPANGSNYQMDIDIFDPSGNKIVQWVGVSGPLGVFQSQLKLSDQPPLGDWSIEVTAMDMEQEKKAFTVEEYVLPKFEVSVILPPFLVMGDDLTGKITAKYTFGKGVAGTGKLVVTRKWGFSKESYSLKFDIDDTYTFRINGTELFSRLAISYPTTLEVQAEVTETLTGNALSDTEEVQYYTRAEKLVFLDGANNFKPGLNYVGYVFLSDQNDKPLGGNDHSLNVTVTVRSNTVKEMDGDVLGPFTVAVQADGMAKISFGVPLGASSAYVRVDFDKTLSTSKSLQPFESISQTYVQVSMITKTPKAGRTASFLVKSTKRRGKVTFVIVARGKIVTNGQGYLRRRRTRLNIMMTSQMTPTSRIIVYLVKRNAEIITDSISFNVRGIFENKVAIGFSKRSSKPGDNVLLKVNAEPGSMCSFQAVDKSVLLLKTGNDITQDMVEDELAMYDSVPPSPCSPFAPCLRMFFPVPNPGMDASSIFKEAGLVVLTDAFLYKKEPMWPIWRDDLDYPMPVMPMEENIMMKAPEAAPSSSSPRVRKIFPETWIFSDEVANAEGRCFINTTVPDTITTWVATAFAMHYKTGLGVAPRAANLITFLKFFIRLELPYSVIRGEQIVLQVTLFNYYKTDMKVRVGMERSDQYQHILVRKDDEGQTQLLFRKKDVYRTVKVPADSGVTVNFPIRPLELGNVDIAVTAISGRAGDAVSRPLLVKPEGIPESYNLPILVEIKPWRDFVVKQPITFPEDVVPGSQRIRISVLGDLLGPTINGLENLLQMPYGCGEQNMINFAPNVYVVNYLDAINNLKPDDLTKAQGFMLAGYQRELTYQHFDGSFSAFGKSDPSGSTWLTAFVAKSFAQAKSFIFIDKTLMEKAIQWLLDRFDESLGIFDEPGRVIHTEMQGGSASGEASLTAFTLIALLEAQDNGFGGSNQTELDGTIDNARTALELAILNEPTTYEASIICYALSLSGSDSVGDAVTILESKATIEDGMMYWEVSDDLDDSNLRWRPPYVQARSRSIEVTSYALLTYASTGDVTTGLKIIKWLVKQRNTNGGFGSTQDTVIALQALSKFASLVYSSDFNLVIRILVNPTGYGKEFRVDGDNALEYQNVDIPNASEVDMVTVTAEGNGTALVEIAVMYNVMEEPVRPLFALTAATSSETINGFELTVCFSWQGEGQSSMVVMEIEMLSGFSADRFSVTELGILKRVDELETKLALYFDEVTGSEECLSVTMGRQGLVAGTQPATIVIYDYYQPEKRATTFYQPKKLGNTNVCDIGGC